MRTPPHDTAAEQALAGAAIDTWTWTGPLPDINPDDFYDPRWKRLYVIGRDARNDGRHLHPDEIPADLRLHIIKAFASWYPPLDKYAERITATAVERARLREAADLLGGT